MKIQSESIQGEPSDSRKLFQRKSNVSDFLIIESRFGLLSKRKCWFFIYTNVNVFLPS